MSSNRYERQERLFGEEGQERLKDSRVAIVGVGGLGSHVGQQLAYLGVGTINLIDGDGLHFTNKNRLIGSFESHPDDKPKTEVVEELIKLINPKIVVNSIPDPLESKRAQEKIIKSDFVFACFDNDGPRASMNELVQAYKIPCLDLATGIQIDHLDFGGRIIFIDGSGCLMCLNELDQDEIREYNESVDQKFDRQEIYGVDKTDLIDSGPSVVGINGVVASLAVNEFMLFITGLRNPFKHIKYNGKLGIVTKDVTEPEPGCYFCTSHRGSGIK